MNQQRLFNDSVKQGAVANCLKKIRIKDKECRQHALGYVSNLARIGYGLLFQDEHELA
jgi:hypothetical protein